jgi:hypothetical protein
MNHELALTAREHSKLEIDLATTQRDLALAKYARAEFKAELQRAWTKNCYLSFGVGLFTGVVLAGILI